MARTVKIDEIGRLIDEKPYNIPWFSFDLGGGWGSRLTKYKKKGAARGTITPGIGNEVSIIQVHKKLKNNDFTDIAGFYVAILCFFGEKIYEKLLRLGVSYREKISTSEVVQMSTEGVEQLEIYFGKYLPQLFYSILAPLTLFIVLSSNSDIFTTYNLLALSLFSIKSVLKSSEIEEIFTTLLVIGNLLFLI